MSRAFVKEQDNDPHDLPPDRPDSGEPNPITPKGLAALKQRLAALMKKRAPMSDEEAQQHKELLRDIKWLESRIARAVVIDPKAQKHDDVQFGATVDAEDEDGKKHRFIVVGEDETDPAQGRISPVSPLGRALMGAKVGDTVTWKRPVGDIELEIVKVQYKAL